MSTRIFTQPVSEIYTLAECYDQLRVDPIDTDSSGENGTRPDDDYIMRLQKAARVAAEEFTGRSVARKLYELVLRSFPSEIELPHPPLISVEDITINDTISENSIDPDEYDVDDSVVPAVIRPVSSWPTLTTGARVRVLFWSGYGVADHMSDADPVPEDIGQAILLGMSFWYRTREGEPLPKGFYELLRRHRIKLGMA